MKIIRIVLIVVIAGLGISAGVSKVLLMPEEMEFFSEVGLNETMLILFGLTQIIGTILFIIIKTRKSGAFVLAFTFGISSIMIFLAGKFAFGLFSLLPLALIFTVTKMNNK